MQVLIAHGDASARAAFAQVAARVAARGIEVIESEDGRDALQLLLAAEGPRLAVIDWDLPGLDGLEICRLVSQFDDPASPYVILLAGASQSLAEGLDAGAGDCVRIPVDADELRARIDAGRRVVERFAPCDVCTASLEAELKAFGEDDEDDDGFTGGATLDSVLVAE
ncbi:MAG: response regulator [Thermoleophilia bacterium]|jgi:DNA-binding response OmpR family regulator|nr:response regulator [Thermoleophilia bacterium]